MLKSACIGFCRNNEKQELGTSITEFLEKKIDEVALLNICKKIRLDNWNTQIAKDIDIIPSNDFSMYDHILDTTCLVGNIQRRFYWEGGKIPLSIYFTMALGQQKDKFDIIPLEMQNWLNTNYLYFVPEFVDPIEFSYSDNKPIVEYLEAKTKGIITRSIILGPISYLLMGKSKEPDIEPLSLLDSILPVYNELFLNYKRIGVKDVQIDEPMLSYDLNRDLQLIYAKCYSKLRLFAGDINIHLTPYYGDIHENFDFISTLPVNSIHIDVSYNKQNIESYYNKLPDDKMLSIGIVDARNVWINNLEQSIDIVSKACDKIGDDRIIISNSSPLFLCPYSVSLEEKIPSNIKDKLSFGVEKLDELKTIKDAINKGKKEVKEKIDKNNQLLSGSKKEYTYFDLTDNLKKIVKKQNRWGNFSKTNKLQPFPTMLAGELNDDFLEKNEKNNEDAIEIQQKAKLDVISCSWLKKSYDLSSFNKNVSGLLTLKTNVIPRFGSDYYYPTIIYDYPEFNDNIFNKCIESVRKKIKKQLLKFSVISCNNFLNFAFINPYLDINKVSSNVKNGLSKNIESISNDIDILQINEMSFTTNLYLQNSKNIYQIKSRCNEINDFILNLKNIKCVGLYCSYTFLNDIIEELCRINADILFMESSNSMHEIMSTFISYKPSMCIGIGAFSTFDNRIPSKNEILVSAKKAVMCLDEEQIIFTPDSDFYLHKDKKSILKSLSTMTSVIVNFRNNIKLR